MRFDASHHVDEESTASISRDYIISAIGRRYRDCRLSNFAIRHDGQQQAVDESEAFGQRFLKSEGKSGENLIYIGPPGTGKDHLMVAVVLGIAKLCRQRIIYRDGLQLFAEFRAAFDSRGVTEDGIVEKYTSAAMLAISDPLPPRGSLSEYEQRILYRIIDGRYRNMRSIVATCNVASRGELDQRLGPQAADRLCDGATVVRCNWPSYRGAK